MKEPDPIVFVIDDDRMIREGLQSLIRSVGLRVETFASAQDFLAAKRPDAPACLVLDVRMPGLSGLDLQLKLSEANIQIPIIFITGHGDIPMSVRAMKEGAHEFLTKPVRGQDLLDAVQKAIASDRHLRKERAELSEIRARFQFAHPSRKGSAGPGRCRSSEQADRGPAGNQRANRQNPPRPRHAENPGRIPRPPGPHGREAQNPPSKVSIDLLLKQDRFKAKAG